MLGLNFICRTPWRSITLQRAREMLLLWAGTMSWRRWLRSWSPGGTSFSYSLIVGLTPLMLQSLMTTSPFRKVPMPLSSDDITLLFPTWRELKFPHPSTNKPTDSLVTRWAAAAWKATKISKRRDPSWTRLRRFPKLNWTQTPWFSGGKGGNRNGDSQVLLYPETRLQLPSH